MHGTIRTTFLYYWRMRSIVQYFCLFILKGMNQSSNGIDSFNTIFVAFDIKKVQNIGRHADSNILIITTILLLLVQSMYCTVV